MVRAMPRAIGTRRAGADAEGVGPIAGCGRAILRRRPDRGVSRLLEVDRCATAARRARHVEQELRVAGVVITVPFPLAVTASSIVVGGGLMRR